jgi:hypothetical protein
MHPSILKFVLIAAGSAVAAMLGVFLNAAWQGKDPSDFGPRALISEFAGSWICLICLICSLWAHGTPLRWKLLAVATLAAWTGMGLSYYFARTPEVPETPDPEPTGLKNDFTNLHL